MIKKAVTLVELIIAIALLGVIVLGAMAFDRASRGLLNSSERRTQVLNEATFALEHITRCALNGIGNVNEPALQTASTPYNETILCIQTDFTQDGRYEPFNASASAVTDRTVGYALDTVNHQIFYCPNTAYDHRAGQGLPGEAHEILTSRATGFTFNINGNTATVEVTTRLDPTQPVDQRDNPEVNITTTIETPGYSLN
ncbi:MAG: prepilin-type N-terminal cleavage/methylation domain-containing protein [Candidatus Omnitrophica bacterium]|nr:prepilin-type N-terminal cleavage/methylation domain-containing protein [Candidatus Omnitrophota bacterium]